MGAVASRYSGRNSLLGSHRAARVASCSWGRILLLGSPLDARVLGSSLAAGVASCGSGRISPLGSHLAT